jgi:hypothetical protein
MLSLTMNSAVRAGVAAAGLVIVVGWAAGASADGHCDSSSEGAEQSFVEIELTCPPPTSGNTEDEQQDIGYEPPEFWSYQPVWGTQPESGEPCIDLLFRANVEPNSMVAAQWEMQTLQMMADARLDGVVNFWCDAAAAEAMQTPNVLANGFVRRIPLPEPELEIDPGFALTGMPAYLVIGNQDGFTVIEALAGWGAMQVTFTPDAFEVDWGDGTVEQITDGRTGVSWNGPAAQQISHVYADSDRHRGVDGNTVVTVSSTWSAEWSVAGFAGTVNGMVIDEAFDLPVREYRAVRGNASG